MPCANALVNYTWCHDTTVGAYVLSNLLHPNARKCETWDLHLGLDDYMSQQEITVDSELQ